MKTINLLLDANPTFYNCKPTFGPPLFTANNLTAFL